MQGSKQNWGMTDANDIPDRQAFEWYKSDTGKGMAYWYKNGPWWQHNNNDVPNDGISLQEEQSNPGSLWNFYRLMIRLRKNNPVLIEGNYKNIINNNDHVFSFVRYVRDNRIMVIVNLSADKQDVVVDMPGVKNIKSLYGIEPVSSSNKLSIKLPAYGIAIWDVR